MEKLTIQVFSPGDQIHVFPASASAEVQSDEIPPRVNPPAELRSHLPTEDIETHHVSDLRQTKE